MCGLFGGHVCGASGNCANRHDTSVRAVCCRPKHFSYSFDVFGCLHVLRDRFVHCAAAQSNAYASGCSSTVQSMLGWHDDAYCRFHKLRKLHDVPNGLLHSSAVAFEYGHNAGLCSMSCRPIYDRRLWIIVGHRCVYKLCSWFLGSTFTQSSANTSGGCNSNVLAV